MNAGEWDVALLAAARALGLGTWRVDLEAGVASWDEATAEMIERTGPEPTTDFIGWLTAGSGDESLPAWSEDRDWVSSFIHFRGLGGPRYLRFAGRRQGLVWEGSVQDVTGEHMLRLRVAEAERMEAMGRFSAGVAHNFNNMLMIIDACLTDAQDRLALQTEPDPQLVEDIEDAHEAARRAGLVVAKLTELSRAPDPATATLLDVGALCSNAVRGLRRVATEDLEIVLSAEPGLWVRQPPGVLEEALDNLLTNANYAVRDRARPSVFVNARRSESFGVPTLEVVVGDNGEGVPADLVPNLFEPFATSKGQDGTGLGLATAAEAIRRLGGQIAHRERDGGGAEFVIVLPLAKPPAASPRASGARRAKGDLDGRRVLVIDDEPAIRRLTKRILERAGARVATAADLASARAMLTPPHDAVLLDRTLGRERGVELIEDLRATSPATPVLFFSGEPVDAEERALVDGVVSKPVSAAALVAAISELLAQP